MKKKKKRRKNKGNKNKKENISSIRSIINLGNNCNNNGSNNKGMITSNINNPLDNIINNTISNEEQKIIDKVKKIMEYTDNELNDLSYELAINKDKRTYCVYYLSLVRTKHPVIFSFCYDKDYNSKIIKMDLFFINYAVLYTVNALFFDDNTMHKI